MTLDELQNMDPVERHELFAKYSAEESADDDRTESGTKLEAGEAAGERFKSSQSSAGPD